MKNEYKLPWGVALVLVGSFLCQDMTADKADLPWWSFAIPLIIFVAGFGMLTRVGMKLDDK